MSTQLIRVARKSGYWDFVFLYGVNVKDACKAEFPFASVAGVQRYGSGDHVDVGCPQNTTPPVKRTS